MLADLFESGEKNPLEEKLRAAFEGKRISFANARVWATPRRLVFFIEGAAPRQAAKENLIRVMAKDGAYNADGTASDKLKQILMHRNADANDLVTADAQGKSFLFLKENLPVQATEKILPELLTALVKSLAFSKNMRWDASGVVFPRPIRSFLCLYGSKAVSFKIGNIPVAAKTRLFQRARFIFYPVKNIPSYFKLLKTRGVTLDQKVRKADIQKQIAATAKAAGGKLYEDPFLLNEVNYLTEAPHALAAPFADEFLSLPLEVLTVSMARKQRIFGLLDKEGRVFPKFIGVLDGKPSAADQKSITRNYEKILLAKLQDSLFFYREDSKIPLTKKRDELKDLVFLKGAGSMLDKTDRLEKLAKKFSAAAGLSSDEQKALERAAHLAKADLLTQMVGEFPELQGVMGRYYSISGGESRAAAAAIGEQYLPRTAGDRLPETKPGALLSLFDKIDLITACYALGMEPSSSLDPYGLRRSAAAILKIMIDRDINIPISELIRECRGLLGSFVPKDKEGALDKKVEGLLKDRFKALVADRGYREDLAEACMATRFERPLEVYRRLEAVARVQTASEFSQAGKVVERISNILRGNKETLPDAPVEAVFTEELERELYRAYAQVEPGFRGAVKAGDTALATSLYAKAFFDIVGRFFEQVFVNAPDLGVRKNRLALLKAVQELYTTTIADLSKIKREGI